MTILVTGSAGHLGEAVLRTLRARGLTVHGVDLKKSEFTDQVGSITDPAVGRRFASCHTDSYVGTKAVARLAGQREEYLVKALHDYKAGQRVGGGVAVMADIAYALSEEEITALAHYLTHLR
jgi:cytochrome c553